MEIVGALDAHRRQNKTKTLDLESGEVRRGRISPAAREPVREWLERFAGREAHVALEGTTGWRYIVEEIERAGQSAHPADPAETAAKRGRKKRARTDDADCDLQLELLLAGRLPESWIPPAHIVELRTWVRTRTVLLDERIGWQQRLQAQLFHQGVPPGIKPRTRGGSRRARRLRAVPGRQAAGRAGGADDRRSRCRARAARPPDPLLRPPPAGLPRARRAPVRRRRAGQRLPARRARRCPPLPLLRRCRPPSVLDVTVYESDRKRAPGHLSHEGPELLRWALLEAAQRAARRQSPDHAYLPAGEGADRPQPRPPLGRPQALPPRLPPAARARRGRARPRRRPPTQRRGGAASGLSDDHRARPCPLSERWPAACSRKPPAARPPTLDGLERPSDRSLARGPPHRSSCRRTHVRGPR